MTRVTGNQGTDKPEGEVDLERQLAAAAAEQERRRAEKEAALREKQTAASSSSAGGSIRDKYLDKISKLKARLTGGDATTSAASTAVAPSVSDVTASVAAVATSKGLTTWIVNDGTNEVLVRHACIVIFFGGLHTLSSDVIGPL
jgi:hypothetical protein